MHGFRRKNNGKKEREQSDAGAAFAATYRHVFVALPVACDDVVSFALEALGKMAASVEKGAQSSGESVTVRHVALQPSPPHVRT
jgi:hypothetical protein